ncbi:MAG: DctP family TRAP transporter solute-binding subunit [Pseudomonadota bacterium]
MPRRLLLLTLALSLLLAAPAWCVGLTLGVGTKPGSSQNLLAERFAQLLAERSQGRLKVEILHSGAAGNESQVARHVLDGQMQLAVLTAGVLDGLAPEVRALEYPFLFADYSQVDRVLQGPAGQMLLEALARAGFKGLAYGENGFRHLTNNLRPVRAVGDVAGLRVRVMNSEMAQALWGLLGASPLAHPFPINDLLARGEVDGQENPLWVIKVYELNKLQKHLSLTAHVYSAHLCLANLAWFDRLPPADQALVSQCMDQAATEQRARNRSGEASILAELKAAGMQVEEHPDRASFMARAAALEQSPLLSAPGAKATLLSFRQALK